MPFQVKSFRRPLTCRNTSIRDFKIIDPHKLGFVFQNKVKKLFRFIIPPSALRVKKNDMPSTFFSYKRMPWIM